MPIETNIISDLNHYTGFQATLETISTYLDIKV